MLAVPDNIKRELAHPFGSLCRVEELISTGKKLVAVGDAVSLATIKAGAIPFVSVFDGKTLREPISLEELELLKNSYETLLEAENPPSHFNPEILEKASFLMKEGGALFVKGEEDIAGLAFLKHATDEHIVYYGIRGLGLVMVEGKQGSKIADYFLKKIMEGED